MGIYKTYDFLRQHVFIRNMKKAVESYVNACPTCKHAKPSRRGPKGLMETITSPSRPFSVFCIDFITGLPLSTQRNDAVLTITDKFTKFIRVLIGKEIWTAQDWAQAYYTHIFPTWGLPELLGI
jgi:hypothetical protein